MKEKSLRPWDGLFQDFQYLHPAGLLVDPEGNIYYTGSDGLPALWCAVSQLSQHLHRLWTVTEGKTVVDLWYLSKTGRSW